MDTTPIHDLAATATALLVVFLKKTGEKLSEEAGRKIAGLFAKQFENRVRAKKALNKLKEVPDSPQLQEKLRAQVELALAADERFVHSLQSIIAAVKGPESKDHIEIDVRVAGNGRIGQVIGKISGKE